MAAVAFHLKADPESLPCATAPDAKLQVRVLLIEDSEESMWLVHFALEEFGQGKYQLDWVTSLSSGSSQLTRGEVDLVLLDLGLPEASGPASYARVRAMAPQTPVVVLTGDTREETEFEVVAGGAEGYLIKEHVSGALLLQAMRAALYANKKGRSGQNTAGLFSAHPPKKSDHWQ